LHAPTGSLQSDQAPYEPVFTLHVRVCVPQLPHARDAGPCESQFCPGQAAGHLHSVVHVCVPPDPHVRVVPGEQSPSFEHADQPDHVPSLVLHVRVRVPHSPQPSTEAPTHFCPVQASSH
jgi:hypothetical protein